MTLTEQLRELYSIARVRGWDEAAGIVQERLPNWWIATGSLAQDGRKVAGPYPTRQAALDARARMQDYQAYWAQHESPSLTEATP